MKNLLKKVALVLSFAMIFTAMPMSVFAADATVTNETELKDAVLTSGTVTLGNDITLTETLEIPAGVTVTLELGTYKIIGNVPKTVGHVIKNNGTLITYGGEINSVAENGGSAIYNAGTATVNGTVINGAPNGTTGNPSYAVNNYAIMEINNATVTSYHGALASNSDSTLTLNNVNATVYGFGGSSHVIYTSGTGKVIINDGIYKHNGNGDGSMAYVSSGTKVEVNAGEFTATGGAYGMAASSSAELNINGGTFNNKIETWGGDIEITGGTFPKSFNPQSYVPATSEVTKDDAGNNVVKPFTQATGVAEVGGKYYGSIAAAVAAANGAEVTLLKETTEKITLPVSTVLNLNLNNNKLNGYILAKEAGTSVEIKNGTIVNDDANESAVEAAVKLTLTNVNITSARHAVRVDGANADVTINGGTYIVKDYVSGKTQHAINVSGNGATVVIKNGTFTGPKGTTANSGAAVCVQAGSTVTIENGNFSGGMNNSSPLTNSLKVEGTLNVYGGTYDIDPAAYVVKGYHACKDGSNFVVHEMTFVEKVPATCTATGTEAYYKCEATQNLYSAEDGKKLVTAEELVIQMAEHDYEPVAAVAPGCTTTGLTAGERCSVCGDIKVAQNVIPATGHSFGGWYTTKEPNCYNAGVEVHVCTACGLDEGRPLPATTHNFDVNGTCAICGITKGTSAPSRANPNTGVHF